MAEGGPPRGGTAVCGERCQVPFLGLPLDLIALKDLLRTGGKAPYANDLA